MERKITAILTVIGLGLSMALFPAAEADAGHRYRNDHRRGHDLREDYRRPGPWKYRSRSPWVWKRGHRGFRYRAAVVGAPWNRSFVGSLIGGAAGGVLGSQIGGGSGRTAAIIGGSVLGVLVGSNVGRSMDAADRLYVHETLEYTPTRSSVAWQNPDTATEYVVTPLETYQDPDGRYCREYQTTASVGGKTQQIYGTACRQPDGSWQVVR